MNKNDLDLFLEKLVEKLPLPFAINPRGRQPENWHQLDAALAWLTGWRYFQVEALSFGEAEKGLIWI